ncbi:glucose dehydrogenase [FAD, quinone]-like [Aricia agestis]|uniref:glucose dehydrogenase [FAD, quinone]-like n=1 Tax=Aricia agestis TaxID=91739 RepID=UPI001C208DA6|nr:glucose dehydrogenase [FAD, quinone]-like [Aricia agestis]
MANHGASIKSIVSSTRIMFSLLPGMGALILIRMLIHLYRTDIEDIENRIPDTPADQLYDYYDFIIVGAGSAGSVLAARLSENKDWKILLLEAGQNENVLSEVPAMFPVLQTSAIDWQFVTEPSGDYCLSMIGKRCKWPRGKLLGGSSAINAMLYIRGNKKDYDYWASLGNEGWSYDEIFKYFLKAEDMRIPEYQNDPYHATGGPLTVEYFKYQQPITKKVLEAGEQLGYKILDVNGETQSGFTRSHATVREGLRCSTAKGYLRPASKRSNLHVSLHSFVEKVLVDENKSVYGVQFKKHDETRIIKARKEVILSAGAIQSPQLLMLSGIGDAEYLKELGIYPLVNLPGVGRNLQDHVAMGGHSFLFDNPFTNGSDYSFNLNSVASLSTLIDFSIHKEGLLYSMMEAEAMAFVNTKYNPEDDYPDIQFFIAPTADNMDGGWFGKRANGLTDETYAELYEDILYDSSFSIVPLLLRPKSRGYLRLRDSNPYSAPLIYPNYYTHPDDVKIMIEGARIAQILTEQPALQELNTRPNPHRNPGCVKYDLMSDEHLECQARHHTLTIYHPVGTCAMGPLEDENAVVDPRLRVYGINKLRVVDGSVMPTIVSGNTNAPIIMIAEKASDMIKEDWAFETEYPCEISDTCYRQAEETTKTYNESYNMAKPKVPLDVFNETTALFPNIPLEGLKPKIIVNKNKINSPKNEKRTKQNNYYNYHPINRYQDNMSSRQIFNPIVSDPNQYALNPNFAPKGFIANSKQPNTGPYLNPMYQRTGSSIMDHPIYSYQDNISFRQIFNPIVSDPHQCAFNPNFAPKGFAANTNQANTGPNFNPIYQRTMDYNPYWIPQSASYQTPITRGLYNELRNRENKKCRLWLNYNGANYELLQ